MPCLKTKAKKQGLIIKKMANIVAIVGRPNVGKSTFFNRLIEDRKAIMDNVSGVTRDRHYGYAEWGGKNFTVIDTGGYVKGSDDKFEAAIRAQVEIAVEEANVILFMVDIQAGLTDLDKDFANVMRRYNKPVYVVANKADSAEKANLHGEFYALGLGEIYSISSQNGSGTGDLLDQVVSHFENSDVENPNEGLPRIAVLGRPNVGKSSFVNALLGKERNIVTDEAGTTRDAIDTHYKVFGNDFILTDTAGIRRKAKINEDIEFYSVMRSIRALEDSDVCIILLDATKGLEAQDVNIINLADRYGKAIVIMINKWDLVEKESNTAAKLEKEIRERLKPIDYMPIIFTSVINKQRIFQVIEKAVKAYNNKTRKIPTSQLNDWLGAATAHYAPPALKGKMVSIKYMMQFPAKTPSFAFFCNLPQYIKEPYMRYLENQLREKFDFEGTPMRLFFRKK
jgi:GTP-binding protein